MFSVKSVVEKKSSKDSRKKYGKSRPVQKSAKTLLIAKYDAW
jgi:hypothetical protein